MGLKAIGLFWGGTLRLAAISLGSPTSRFLSALERRQLVIRSHCETLSVAMRVNNPDRLSVVHSGSRMQLAFRRHIQRLVDLMERVKAVLLFAGCAPNRPMSTF